MIDKFLPGLLVAALGWGLWTLAVRREAATDPERPAKAAPQAAAPKAPETPADLRAALLADLDKLLGKSSWLVSDEQKRRLRACRAVIADDDAVLKKIAAKLD